MVRRDAFKAITSKINKKYGAGTVIAGCRVMNMKRYPTGSFLLDYVLGGGLPYGRISIFFGEKSSGKTTTAYRIAGIAQNLCANCLRPPKQLEIVEYNLDVVDENTGEVLEENGSEWIAEGVCDCYSTGKFKPVQGLKEKNEDFEARLAELQQNSYEELKVALIDQENSFDRAWAKRVGLDERRLEYIRCDTAEETIDVYDALARTGAIDLFLLDSIAQLTPSAEVEKSAEDSLVGELARACNRMVRKIGAADTAVARETGRQITHIWINQVRENIQTSWGGSAFSGPKTRLPGGKGQGFVSSTELKFWSSKLENEEIATAGGAKVVRGEQVRINFIGEKNKTAPPKCQGSYLMQLHGEDAGQVVDHSVIDSMAGKFDYVFKDKSKWGVEGVVDTFKTKTEAWEWIYADRSRYDRMYNYLLSRLLSEDP